VAVAIAAIGVGIAAGVLGAAAATGAYHNGYSGYGPNGYDNGYYDGGPRYYRGYGYHQHYDNW